MVPPLAPRALAAETGDALDKSLEVSIVMVRIVSLLAVALGGSLLAGVAFAQGAPGMGGRSPEVAAAIQAVIDRFDAAAPEIGEPLQDLTLVDDQGHPANIRELARDQCTVFVLGCLT